MKRKAVFLDVGSLGNDHELDFGPLEQRRLNWRVYENTHPNQVLRRLKDANIVVTNKVVLDERILTSLPQLSLVVIAATGVNNIDIAVAKKLDISVSNSIGYSTDSVAQHTIALMLALTNQIHRYHIDVFNAVWSNSPFFCDLSHPMQELRGKNFGVIGYGAIGKKAAQIARSFGMKVLVAEKPNARSVRAKRVAYEEVIAISDFLSLHCPLTPRTHEMIDEEFIAKMKPTASIINTSRGGLVKQDALLDALDNGRLGGAALDVLDEEPPQWESPMLWTDRPNLVLSPHCAWGALEARQRLIVDVSRNIRSWLRGKVRNPVLP